MTTSAHFSELSVSHVLVPGGRCFPPRNPAHAGRKCLGESGRGGLPRGLSLESQPQYQVWGVCVCVRARPASSRPSKLALHAQACLCLEQRWDSGPGSLMPADLPPSHRGSQVPGPPAARGPGEAWAAGDGRWPHPPCGTLEVAGRLLRATGAGRGPTPRPAGGQPSGTVQACSSGSRWRRAGSGAGPGVDIRPCCSGPARPPATVVKMNGRLPSPR